MVYGADVAIKQVEEKKSFWQKHIEKTWNPLTAALASIIFPGLGQLYKGHLPSGLSWIVITVSLYFSEPLQALLMHLLSAIMAFVFPKID